MSGFECFVADMGPRPVGHTLDRKENDGNYEPDNCQWSTRITQTRNRSNTLIVYLEGHPLTLAELSEKAGLAYGLLHRRIFRRGWTVERAISKPARVQHV